MGAGGFATAFTARFKGGPGGRPHMGVIVEYDALRGTNGAFRRSALFAGTVGIAAAVAIAEFLQKEQLPGTVTVFGTPAEGCSNPRPRP
jgi:metal-dependent amidase/aminoacylase/carboxypeptidase family protein